MKEEIKNPETFVEYMRNLWKNVAETKVDSDGILWLNKNHRKEVLNHKHLRKTAVI